VIREGLVRDGSYGGKQESVDVRTERLQLDERVLETAVGIRLTIYSKQSEEDDAREAGAESSLRVYTYGHRLRFTAKLRMPRNYRNPGAMDMAGYLASQGIRLTGSARAGSVEVLPGFVGGRIELWRSAARRSVLARIMQLWAGERGALMQAMLIGSRAFFGREIKTDFQRTGTYHILVVSGINVRNSRLRGLLGIAKAANGRDLGHHHHDSAFVGLRIFGRSRVADCARDHHPQYLSSDSVAVP
jgi:competence protein ComEC